MPYFLYNFNCSLLSLYLLFSPIHLCPLNSQYCLFSKFSFIFLLPLNPLFSLCPYIPNFLYFPLLHKFPIFCVTYIPGVPQKSLPFLKPVYLRPLISLRRRSVLKMNLWISSFKNTNSKFSRIFVFKDIKGIRYYSHISAYS